MNNLNEAQWNQFKGLIRQEYGNITNDELEKYKGNMDELKGLIQEKVGDKVDDTSNFINSKLESVKDAFKQ